MVPLLQMRRRLHCYRTAELRCTSHTHLKFAAGSKVTMAHLANLCTSLLDVVKCRDSPGDVGGGRCSYTVVRYGKHFSPHRAHFGVQ